MLQRTVVHAGDFSVRWTTCNAIKADCCTAIPVRDLVISADVSRIPVSVVCRQSLLILASCGRNEEERDGKSRRNSWGTELRSAAAAGTLEMWGRLAPQAVPALVSMLSATNGNIATAAVRALPVVTNRADQALPALRSLLAGNNEQARAAAAFALWKFGGDADQTRTILESLLTTPRGKGSAAMYLAKMGPMAQPSVSALLKASHESVGAWVDMFDRAMCAEAVLKIQGESAEAIRELENAIRFQQNSWVRATVAKRVGSLGAVARPLIPALRQALNDADFEVRHEAAKSLNKLETITESNKTR